MLEMMIVAAKVSKVSLVVATVLFSIAGEVVVFAQVGHALLAVAK